MTLCYFKCAGNGHYRRFVDAARKHKVNVVNAVSGHHSEKTPRIGSTMYFHFLDSSIL